MVKAGITFGTLPAAVQTRAGGTLAFRAIRVRRFGFDNIVFGGGSLSLEAEGCVVAAVVLRARMGLLFVSRRRVRHHAIQQSLISTRKFPECGEVILEGGGGGGCGGRLEDDEWSRGAG